MPAQNCNDSIPDFSNAFNYCDPEYSFGEVERVIVAPIDIHESITDLPSMDEAALIAAEASGYIGIIPVKGSLDEPEQPEQETSLYRRAYPPARYTLEGNADDLSTEAYTALRDLNKKRVRMWFVSGKYIFGGALGLISDTRTFPVIEEGEESLHRYHVRFEWRSDGKSPERDSSPWYEDVDVS